MAYDGIGVGVRPSPGPSPSKNVKPVNTVVESVVEKEVEGLGYGIELDEGTIEVSAEMDRGEGSSSSSSTIVLGSDLGNLGKMDDTMLQDEVEAKLLEEKDSEFPSMEEMKVYQERLSVSSEVDNKDLVGMVRLPPSRWTSELTYRSNRCSSPA